MQELPDRLGLLDEIERQQDDLLRELDELNRRVEGALRQHGHSPAAADSSQT